MFRTVLILSFFGLAACSGGSVSPAFQSIADATNDLATQINAGTVTDPADMPSSGSASYSGSAAFGTSSNSATILDDPDMVSDVTISADFVANTVSGIFTNFEDASGKNVTGDLSLSSGLISDETYAANAIGTLDVGGTDHMINGVVVGQFLGSTQDLLGGGFAANRTIGTNTDTLYGTFGATKD